MIQSPIGPHPFLPLVLAIVLVPAVCTAAAEVAGEQTEQAPPSPPTLAAAAGDPWWKVGAQGDENHSNTRNMYLLVKGEYVKLSDFVCPGSKCERKSEVDPAELQTYKDFPSRNCVTYSFRI